MKAEKVVTISSVAGLNKEERRLLGKAAMETVQLLASFFFLGPQVCTCQAGNATLPIPRFCDMIHDGGGLPDRGADMIDGVYRTVRVK